DTRGAPPWFFIVAPPHSRLDWKHPNEETWIVATTARDIAEMLLYAQDRSVPDDATLAFSTKEDASSGARRYVVSLVTRPGHTQTFDLPLAGGVWSPDAYAPLASGLVESLSLKAAPPSSEGLLLDRLTDPRSAVLERESQRVSRRLAEAMLDASPR